MCKACECSVCNGERRERRLEAARRKAEADRKKAIDAELRRLVWLLVGAVGLVVVATPTLYLLLRG